MKQAQSYDSILMRGKFSVYELRIIAKIVQRAQPLLEAQGKFSEFMHQAYAMDGYNVVFHVPFSELAGDKTHNYGPLRRALRSLADTWQVEYWDRVKRVWCHTPIIYNVIVEERAGLVTFSCAEWFVRYIADFRRGGYRVYDYAVAVSLHNPFATRLYMLMSSVSRPVVYSLASLRSILGVDDKYARVSDFVRRVLKPAASELAAREVNGFRYELIREVEGRKHSAVKNIRLIPVKRSKVEINVSQQLVELSESLPEVLVQYLRTQLGFSINEMSGNKETLRKFVLLDDWQLKLGRMVDRMRKGRKNHGYLIQAMKNEVAGL